MITRHVLEQIGHDNRRGLVFAAGGSADLILAKAIAERLISDGCSHVDLAQPLNCRGLSQKDLLGEAGRRHALGPEPDLDPEAVLRHHASVPAELHPDHRRGKGLSISASLEWEHGFRYVCAAHGRGLAALAGRRAGRTPYYDFAIGIDGGGDVLTHGEDEFDRVVVDGFRAGWSSRRPLLLIAMGLGADGGSAPAQFDEVALAGWRSVGTAEVETAFAEAVQRDLERLRLWNESPASWSRDDPCWGYGFKVPQIIALAVRREFPFDAPGGDPDRVLFPRRRELKLMSQRLLREARLFLCEVNR
ncbi:MAG: hypothetical protein H6706_05175 [Myxococcales bacterium]|nr:hypothetical protein [Myxococcales bacterium]